LKSIDTSETSLRVNSLVKFAKKNPNIQSIGYDVIAILNLDAEDQSFLFYSALRSLESHDPDLKRLGLKSI
jgi:hypothetical protein